MLLNLKIMYLDWTQEEIFYDVGTLEQISQRTVDAPSLEEVKVTRHKGFEQPYLLKNVAAHGRGLHWIIFNVLFPPKLF